MSGYTNLISELTAKYFVVSELLVFFLYIFFTDVEVNIVPKVLQTTIFSVLQKYSAFSIGLSAAVERHLPDCSD